MYGEKMTSYTYTYYKGAILEGKKTNTFNHCDGFTNRLVSSTEDMHRTAYIKGQVKPKTYHLTTKKKTRIIFQSPIVDSKEDEERMYSNEIQGGGGEKLDATAMQGNIREEPKPNLDQVIDNIQVEPIVYVEPIVSIIEPVDITIESSQPVQPLIELI
jgi:hypothetical protein